VTRTKRKPHTDAEASVAIAPSDAAAAHAGEANGIDAASMSAASAVSVSNLSLHELFEQQARDMLDRADIDEEQKQAILVGMACPCCGSGGMSFSVRLTPRAEPAPAIARSRPRRPRKSRGR
jgi:hypothetical protein